MNKDEFFKQVALKTKAFKIGTGEVVLQELTTQQKLDLSEMSLAGEKIGLMQAHTVACGCTLLSLDDVERLHNSSPTFMGDLSEEIMLLSGMLSVEEEEVAVKN